MKTKDRWTTFILSIDFDFEIESHKKKYKNSYQRLRIKEISKLFKSLVKIRKKIK